MKIAFVTSEIVPFSKTGGLADVGGALPLALEKLGLTVRVITPKYKSCKKEDDRIGRNINVHFIKNDAFFKRDGLYGDKYGDYKDNLDRFAYFSKAVLEYLNEINFNADIIHCNDWQSALVPLYLKLMFRGEKTLKDAKVLLSIHNVAYQGIFDVDQYDKIGIGREFFNIECMEYYGRVNLLKGGIVFSDFINTVSPTHAEEVQTPEFGYGLDGVLCRYKKKLRGILNGIDNGVWNPEVDGKIKKNYSAKSIEDKYVNKEDLQKVCGLEVNREIPLLGIVSRLADQKGIDLLVDALDGILKKGAQLVLLGTGDMRYHQMLEQVIKKSPKGASINLKFDPVLAQKIYAGCDMFLMPSRYEPCGLGQMISFKYGTIPIARKTGGLTDTVVDCDFDNLSGNGFLFLEYDERDFLGAIERALKVYREKDLWRGLVRRVMSYDFSWENSAAEYIKLYKNITNIKGAKK